MISAFPRDLCFSKKKKKKTHTHEKEMLAEFIKSFSKTFHTVLQISCFITEVGYAVFSK